MPYKLLEQLSRSPLPKEVVEQPDIHKLLSLSAAGFILCSFPALIKDASGGRYSGAAVVTQVTADGLFALKKRNQKRIPHKPH